MIRAYSLLTVKSVDDDQRKIFGIASTPEPDRSGDIVELDGISFADSIPLLLHHDKTRPVGRATLTKSKAEGIPFAATLPVITQPGIVKDRVDEAWDSIKAGLLAGISIGFRILDDAVEPIKGAGLRFLKTEILELSLVAIPANASASITTIKSLDVSVHRSSAVAEPVVVRCDKARQTMTVAEQIKQWENTRAAKQARLTELMTKAADAAITLDEKESEEYDTCAREVGSIDTHLKRLRDLESTQAKAAVPITAATTEQASMQRGGSPVLQVKANVPKATAFIRYAMALTAAKGVFADAQKIAERWRDSTPEVELVLRAAVAAGTTTDATWAGPLVPALQPLANEFLELLRPATVIGRIPNLRKVPFNVQVAAQTAGGSYGWVGQGAPKPVTKLGFGTVTLGFAKAAGIIVLTEELVRFSSPSAEDTCRNDMIKGIAQFLDQQFTDPAVAAVANVSPGSITNGTVAIASSGGTAANALTDIKALVAAFVGANLSTADAVLLMSESNAFALGTALNPLGQPLYPGLGAKGGTVLQIPVITSQVLGTNVIMVDAQGVLYADDGGVNLDVSREASLQMDSAPMNPPDATVVHVSLWQQNLVGLRAERFINWKRARLESVKYVSGAAYV